MDTRVIGKTKIINPFDEPVEQKNNSNSNKTVLQKPIANINKGSAGNSAPVNKNHIDLTAGQINSTTNISTTYSAPDNTNNKLFGFFGPTQNSITNNNSFNNNFVQKNIAISNNISFTNANSDGRIVVIVENNEIIKVICAENNKIIAISKKFESKLYKVAISNAGRYIASFNEWNIVIWDRITDKYYYTNDRKETFTEASLCFNNESDIIVIRDNVIQRYKNNGVLKSTHEFDKDLFIDNTMIVPYKNGYVMGNKHGIIAKTSKDGMNIFEEHTSAICGLIVMDGETIISVSKEGKLSVRYYNSYYSKTKYGFGDVVCLNVFRGIIYIVNREGKLYTVDLNELCILSCEFLGLIHAIAITINEEKIIITHTNGLIECSISKIQNYSAKRMKMSEELDG